MNPIFPITDSKGGTLNVKNISRDGQYLYQLTSIHGDYAEVSYIKASNSWILPLSQRTLLNLSMILKRLANRFKNIYDSKYQPVTNIESTPEQDGILENAKKFAKDNAIQD